MSPQPAPSHRGTGVLRAIAIVKLLEVVGLIGGGLAAMRLLDPKVVDWINDWAATLPIATEQHIAQHLLAWLGDVPPRQIRQLSFVAFALALVYAIEGIGLWLDKRWGEWFSVIATSLFIPLELAELIHHASWVKALTLGLNVMVVWYLLVRLKRYPKGT